MTAFIIFGLGLITLIVLSLFTAVPVKAAAAEITAIPEKERNKFPLKESPWGRYWQFIPDGPIEDVLVVVHGTPEVGDCSSVKLSLTYISRWLEFAKQHQLIVLTPAFDWDNYQMAEGGFRNLYGRHCGADEFVINLVNRYKHVVTDFDGRFYLYGHSAGGQFSGRFSIRRPQLLKGLILSAPGRYAFPDESLHWPYGMGKYSTSLDWGNGYVQQIEIEPDLEGWVKASQIPTVIVVGSNDLSLQPHYGLENMTRIDLAVKYTADMKAFAAQHGKDSLIKLRIVPGATHDTDTTTPAEHEELSALIAANRTKKQPL